MNDYPHLFAQGSLGIPGMTVWFQRLYEPPPQELISNINCVPFLGDDCVVLTLDDGSPEIPGGTLEPDETYEETLRRELREEAGVNVLDFKPVGAWRTYSSLAEPFRSHLPHPTAYRYIGYANVEVVSLPTNDGEQVVAVDVLSVTEGSARFHAAGRPDLAELYQLAAHIRSQK